MALTAEAARLTEAHQAAQERNAALIYLLVLRYWSLVVKPDNLAETSGQWLNRLVPFILRSRLLSESLSRQYLVAFRRLEIGNLEPFASAPVAGLPDEAIRKSLYFTGPKSLQTKIEAIEKQSSLARLSGDEISPVLERALLNEAFQEAGRQASASALRHVQNGQREQILSASKEDKKCLGYLRVTDSDPCYFCAMLASRGPVYEDGSFDLSNPLFSGDGPSKAHDSCNCTLEPVYGARTTWPGRSREFSELWAQTGSVKEFRRAYDRIRRES